MTNVGSVYVNVLPSAQSFGSMLTSQTTAASAAAGSAASKQFGGTFLGGLKNMAKSAGLLFGAAAVIGFVKSSVTVEAQFSKTMKVMQTVAKVPQKDMERLSDLALRMGRDTVFSANDAADAMLNLAKGGLKPAVIEAGALEASLTLAAAGDMELAEAGKAVVRGLNAFHLSGKDASIVASALAGAANASTAEVSDLTFGLAQSAMSAASAGLSIEETTAALAAFTNEGMRGQDAGTSLKTMLARLVPQTDKAKGAMEDLGIITRGPNGVSNAFFDAQGNMKGMVEIAGVLQGSLKGLTQEERIKTMHTLFGSDATRAATILMNQGESGMRKYIKATSDRGAAERVAAAAMSGTAGAMEQFRGSWETLQLSFGQAIKPLTEGLLGIGTTLLNILSPAFTILGTVLGPILKMFAGLLDFLMPAIGVVLAFAAGVKVLTLAKTAWLAIQLLLSKALLASPVMWVVGIIALLVAIVVKAYKENETFRKIVQEVWAAIKSAIKTAWERWIEPALKAFWRFVNDDLGPVLKWLWDKIVKPAFAGIGAIIKTAWELVIHPILKALWAFINDVLGPIIKWLWEKIVGPAFVGIGVIIKTAWDKVIKPVFETLKNWVGKDGHLANAFRTAVSAIGEIWDRLKEAARKPVEFVVETVYNNGIRKVINLIPGVPNLPEVHMATGGRVNGQGGETSDSIPAWLSKNEFVVQAKYAKRVYPLLEAINKGALHFAKGGRVWPVPGRDVGTYPGHDGIDINRGSGWDDYRDPIWAAAPGKVSYVGTGRGYGLATFIRGPYGELVYGHMDSALAKAGAAVLAGQQIGYVGNTGNSSAPHLHFGFPGGSPDAARAFLRGADVSGGSDGGLLSVIASIKDAVSGFWSNVTGWIGNLTDMGGWGPMLTGMVGGLASSVREWVMDKITSLDVFDQGGILSGVGVNTTGRPERVLTPEQTVAFERLVEALDRQTSQGDAYDRLVEEIVGLRRDIKRLPNAYRLAERQYAR